MHTASTIVLILIPKILKVRAAQLFTNYHHILSTKTISHAVIALNSHLPFSLLSLDTSGETVAMILEASTA